MNPSRKSPFPGLDPFLQRSWGDAHTELIVGMRGLMLDKLPEGLRARVQESVALEETDDEGWTKDRDYYVPGVIVTESQAGTSHWHPGYAIREYDPGADPETGDVLTVQGVEETLTARFIEVRDTRDGNRLISTIEFLSPANKNREGAEKFCKKQRELFRAGVSLVEIDFLRGGRIALFQPEKNIGLTTGQYYYVCVTAAWWRGKSKLHRIRLRNRLPSIWVPLRPGDPPLAVNLQELHDMVYDRGRYGQDIDYTKEPEPPLDEDDKQWADTMLRAEGLRP